MAGSASRGDRRKLGASVWLAAVPLLAAPAVWADPEPPSATPAAAESAASATPAAEPAGAEVLVPVQQVDPPPRNVELDDLLRLPQGYSSDVERRGGATRGEWMARFENARKEAESAKKKLVELNAELDKLSVSSSSWQVAAPGNSDPQTSPLNLRLRQDIKAQRELIDEAERRLRALHVEADLAAVPAGWRE